jgi:hypothetical protein
MSNQPVSTILFLGLSSSGKTNFLVALDVVLDDQSDNAGLAHAGFAPDRGYLQPLKEKWLRGEELEHTSRQQPPPPHHLLVRHPKTGKDAELHLPDLAGENFDSYFETRSFPKDFAKKVTTSAGLLLFVHCDHNADHAILEHVVFKSGASTAPVGKIAAWRLEDASRQVKLVDLLHFLAEVRGWRQSLRLAVIISAWDLVERAHAERLPGVDELPNDPTRFLQRRWPLLDQFLASHSTLFPSRVFGVSARGGGTTPEEMERLTNFDRPVDRISVVDFDGRSNDITRPVRWVLGLL